MYGNYYNHGVVLKHFVCTFLDVVCSRRRRWARSLYVIPRRFTRFLAVLTVAYHKLPVCILQRHMSAAWLLFYVSCKTYIGVSRVTPPYQCDL